MADLAPIILFVYNRPEHTRLTLAALAANPLAIDSDLIIYADAPKKPEHAVGVSQTKGVARSASGFKSVSLVERCENFGLARSIILGVTEACDASGRVIVLEDDLVVAPSFLSYMNRALDLYENEEKVMQIAGYMFPVDHPQELPPAFFLRLSSTWGWATWRRAWAAFESDSEVLLKRMRDADSYQFDMNGSHAYMQTLVSHSRGELDVWGVRWYASMFLQKGLCLHPAQSFVRNIGMDGSGEHCGPSDVYDVVLGTSLPSHFPEEIVASAQGEAKVVDFFRRPKPPIFRRAISRLKRALIKDIR